MNIALIVFAGQGTRINSSIPKQFIQIKGKEIVVYTIEAFQNSPEIDEIVLVTGRDYIEKVNRLVKKYSFDKVKHVLVGGNTRQESVKNGLLGTDYDAKDNILIHDGDRPLINELIIKNNVDALKSHDVVCTYIPHAEALGHVSNLGRVKIVDNVRMDVQTPQSFKYGLIKKYHIERELESFSDDIGLVEEDHKVFYLHGSKYNFKVTTDIDLKVLESLL